MTPIYIAAPYAPRPGLTTTENITRAHALARHAMRLGYAPVVIHGAVQVGVFGNDDDPEERARGIEAACAIAAAIGRAGGELWLLVLPEGGLSSGCEREARAFESARFGALRWFEMDSALNIREIP